MVDANLQEQLIRLCEPEVELAGLRLVDLEPLGGGGRITLRFSVERENGDAVDVEDCARASRALARVLEAEAESLLAGRYVIEVSSPGLFRPLRRPEHFRRSLGETVKLVATDERPDESERTLQLRGTLEEVDDAGVSMRIESGETIRLPFDRIRKAHLDPELDFGRGRRNRGPNSRAGGSDSRPAGR